MDKLAQEIGNPALGPALQGFAGSEGGSAFFSAFLPRVVTFALIAGALVFFFMLVSGSIQWISSGGDKQALEAARTKISQAIVGLLILFASFALIQFMETFFGINILTLDIGVLKIQ